MGNQPNNLIFMKGSPTQLFDFSERVVNPIMFSNFFQKVHIFNVKSHILVKQLVSEKVRIIGSETQSQCSKDWVGDPFFDVRECVGDPFFRPRKR